MKRTIDLTVDPEELNVEEPVVETRMLRRRKKPHDEAVFSELVEIFGSEHPDKLLQQAASKGSLDEAVEWILNRAPEKKQKHRAAGAPSRVADSRDKGLRVPGAPSRVVGAPAPNAPRRDFAAAEFDFAPPPIPAAVYAISQEESEQDRFERVVWGFFLSSLFCKG
jgi:hypothetical protein